MNPSEFTDAFQRLDSILFDTQPLWRPQPFTTKNLDWCQTHPYIHDELLALSTFEAGKLHEDSQRRIRWFRQYEPSLCEALYQFDPLPSVSVSSLAGGRFDKVDIPGRKWEQITAFARALPRDELPLVDWCAGKGHLSRIVQGSQQQPVHCLEWDAGLVASGIALAGRQSLDIHYHHHDVMQSPPVECSGSAMRHIGLHACGDLHVHLLRHVVKSAARSVALSPCCYHKIATSHYSPLSSIAKQSALVLGRSDLHLAVQDTVTASLGERRLRERERIWRLAFDALQRDIRESDDYISVPSIKRGLLRKEFQDFCQWAASSREIRLPKKVDYDLYLRMGRENYRRVFRLELLRRLFNRPLELWLVLDRAMYLEEQGYAVNISRFCEGNVSPRNLLIQGRRRA